MKKILISMLFTAINSLAFALPSNKAFQQFDNHVSFGVNYQNGNFNTSQENGNPNQFSMTSLNIEVEKLFDIGLWGNFNAGVAQTYTETSMGINGSAAPLGSYPYLQTMNLKVGYNFPLLENFAITPYLAVGKNTNLTFFTSIAGAAPPGGQNANVTNDFFYAFGGGLRLEYVVNKYFNVFVDQAFRQNLDQTNYNLDPIQQSNIPTVNASNNQWITELGLRVNPWEKLQLGTSLFYNNYTNYDSQSVNTLNAMGVAVPTTSFGFQLSAGFTFE
jgi:hypothetical protein